VNEIRDRLSPTRCDSELRRFRTGVNVVYLDLNKALRSWNSTL